MNGKLHILYIKKEFQESFQGKFLAKMNFLEICFLTAMIGKVTENCMYCFNSLNQNL